MNLTMIGAGYVGLVTGACLAEFGHFVTCVDRDHDRIEGLKRGECPIFEPGLEGLITNNMMAGRLSFVSDLRPAVASADAVFIAVGTPSRRGDGYADLSYVMAAAAEIAEAISGYTVVITKSTVPVCTGDDIETEIRRLRPDADFSVVSNPEFLREGAAIEDFKHPNRIVVGVQDARAQRVMEEIYRPLFLNQSPILYTDRRTAELIKYAANAFLATKISFINEMADLCEVVGADVQELARGIGLDNRIGQKFLHPGPGYGGSCFPKDTLALIKTGEKYLRPLRIVSVVNDINNRRKQAMARRIAETLGDDVEGKTIALLGLTFKPNTDDMREAPSLDIIQGLIDMGAEIRVFDPEGMKTSRAFLNDDVTYAENPYHCAEGADALVIVTEWDEFRALSLERLKSVLKHPTIIDLRNIYRPAEMQAAGFDYYSIGRPMVPRSSDGIPSRDGQSELRSQHLASFSSNGASEPPKRDRIQPEEQPSQGSNPSTMTDR